MRHVSFVVVALGSFVFAACGGGDDNQPPKTPAQPVATTAATTVATDMPKPVEPAKPAMTPQQAMQKTMGAYGTAMMAKDAKALAALYTDDAKMITAGVPDVVGRDAIPKHFEHEMSMLKDSKSSASRIWIKNDVAIIEWSMSGVPQGEMMGMKGNEKPVGVTGISVEWYTPEGLIKEEHGYMDMGTIMAQMGVLKSKARPVPTMGTTPPVVMESNGSADEAKNVDVAKTLWTPWEKGAKGESEFTGSMADDIQWDDMTMPETMKGKASASKYYKTMLTAFPDVKGTVQNAWAVGDYVIVEGTTTGTQNGPFMGAPASKKPVTMHSLDVAQVKNGKLVRGWTYGNSVEVMSQLGMMPKPPVAKDGAKPATPATPATPKK